MDFGGCVRSHTCIQPSYLIYGLVLHEKDTKDSMQVVNVFAVRMSYNDNSRGSVYDVDNTLFSLFFFTLDAKTDRNIFNGCPFLTNPNARRKLNKIF